MKNLLKKVSTALLAVAFGLGLIFTQSAFSKKTASNEYGKYMGQWYNYDNPGTGLVSRCDLDEVAKCTSIFTTPPVDGSSIPDGGESSRLGHFSIDEE